MCDFKTTASNVLSHVYQSQMDFFYFLFKKNSLESDGSVCQIWTNGISKHKSGLQKKKIKNESIPL